MIQEVWFVYNADSGLLNMLNDGLHKMVSPKTYPCHLCAVTYGITSMHREWKAYLQFLPYQVVFFHRDELPSDVPEAEYPCVFIRTNDRTHLLMDREQIESCEDVSDLIRQVKSALTDVEQNMV